VSLDYNSQTPNGWLGAGFDITVSSITIDTKFGVPDYDGDDIYLLNGQELTFVENNSSGSIYRSRVEGAFQKIIRKGSSANNSGWLITLI
jgi:hypothetical protein